MSDQDIPNKEEILRAITYIYSEEQIEEIREQLPVNLKTCIERIDEIQQQLNQYDVLTQHLEQKILKADHIIADQATLNDDIDYTPKVLDVNCQSITGRRSSNEDEEVATIIKIEQKPRFQFLAVFDGHGGNSTAHFCKTNLLNFLMQTKFIQYNFLSLALQEAIIQADQNFCELDSEKGQVGTTAACVLIDLKRQVLAMANTGDARVVVQLNTGIYYQTTDHKPSSPDEKQRLKDNFNAEVQEFGGVARVNGQLAVSRAIGDIDFKIFGVISMPQVYEEINLQDVDFVIIACDGLWDVITTEQAIQIVQYCLGTVMTVDQDTEKLAKAAKLYFDGHQEQGDQLLSEYTDEHAAIPQIEITKEDTAGKLSQILVRLAYMLDSQDNITCIVALNSE